MNLCISHGAHAQRFCSGKSIVLRPIQHETDESASFFARRMRQMKKKKNPIKCKVIHRDTASLEAQN